MRRGISLALRLLGGQIAAIPLAFIVLIALMPVLRSLESATELELVGHSGPADWVIFVVWAVISLIITATLLGSKPIH